MQAGVPVELGTEKIRKLLLPFIPRLFIRWTRLLQATCFTRTTQLVRRAS